MQLKRNRCVFKAYTLCVSVNSRFESNKEDEEETLRRSQDRPPNPQYRAQLPGTLNVFPDENYGVSSLRLWNLVLTGENHVSY